MDKKVSYIVLIGLSPWVPSDFEFLFMEVCYTFRLHIVRKLSAKVGEDNLYVINNLNNRDSFHSQILTFEAKGIGT